MLQDEPVDRHVYPSRLGLGAKEPKAAGATLSLVGAR